MRPSPFPEPEVEIVAARLRRTVEPDGPGSLTCRRACEVVAGCAPHAPVARLAILVRYAVWSVGLDDRLDGPAPDWAALDRLRHAVAAALAPTASPVAGEFLRELRRIVDDLAGCDRQGLGTARFRDSLREAVDAAITHAVLGQAVADGRAPAPDAEGYLAVAAKTINYHSYAYALLAVACPALRSEHLGAVDEALGAGAAAVRLANDLRSLDRDREEATLNILQLRTASGMPVTRPYVEDAIDERVSRHHMALSTIDMSEPAALLRRSLELSVDLYRRADLR